MNFLRGNDIAFHINPRFNEGGKQVVVRNHKIGEAWGTEERDMKGPFPFAPGSPFEVSLEPKDLMILHEQICLTVPVREVSNRSLRLCFTKAIKSGCIE